MSTTRCVLPVALLTSMAPPEPTRTHTRVLTRWALTHDGCREAGWGPPCGKTVKLLAAVESTLTMLSPTSTTPEDGTPPTPTTFTDRVFPAPIAPPVACVSSTRVSGSRRNRTRAVGVTAAVFAAAPVPAVLVAVTKNVYVVSLVSPLTTAERALPETLIGVTAGDAVMV